MFKIANKFLLPAGLALDVPILYNHDTEYTSSNKTHADYMWDSLSIDPMIIAPTLEWAESMNLPSSWEFPWDSNRRIYFIKVFHQLHCLVCTPCPPFL